MISDRERDVLKALKGAEHIRPAWKGWLTPMYVGGTDASHHSATLVGLCKKGLVERRQRAGWTRRSYLYRITDAGRDALNEKAR